MGEVTAVWAGRGGSWGRLASAGILAAGLAGCGSDTATTGPIPVPAPAPAPAPTPTPLLSLSVGALSFGSVVVGAASAAQTVTLTNSGTASLVIAGVAVTGEFTGTNGCGASLAVGATCSVAVVFGPATAGARTGALTVTSNAAGNPAMVALSGTGLAAAGSFQVTVRAGARPVVGAAVRMYAAGAMGNGSAALALLSTAAVTNAAGMALVPTTFQCGAAPVYLVARGGGVGGSGASDGNLALMTAVGACGGVAAGASFAVDEVTTVAAAYGLAQFYGGGGDVGATASNGTGLVNAFATAATLADPGLGTSPGATLPGSASSPAARVNSVANMLNACLVSSGACAGLYGAATVAGGTAPTNTLDAAFAVARNPGSNVGALYAAAQASAAYGPALGSVPADWTMFINYSGGGLNSPSGVGVDSTGSVWVANYFGVASKFSTTGAPVFASGVTGAGLNNSYGLAVDGHDAVWVANEQPRTAQGIGSMSVLSAGGVSQAGPAGYTAGGLNYPLSVAIDPNGTVWVVDYGNSSLTLLSATGVPLSGAAGYTTANFAFPVAVAVDGNHFGWVVNQASNYVTKVAPDGSSFTNYLCCNLASGIAIDAASNIWVANYYGDSVSLMTNAGVVVSNSLTGAGSVRHPQGIAVDGAGTVWVANYRAPYLTELAGAGATVPGAAVSPAGGLGGDAGQLEAYALALDASGNVWVSNAGSNTVTKFIGLAVPVKTPLLGLPRVP